MSEENSALATAEAAPAPAPSPAQKPTGKKHGRRHPVRTLLIALAVLALLAAGVLLLVRFLNRPASVNSQIQTSVADFGSIQSSVQGSGSARAKESAVITLQNAGTVQKLYVSEGQVVSEGELLYEIVSPAAQAAYDTAVDRVRELQRQVGEQYDALTQRRRDLSDRQEEYQDILEEQRLSNEERFVKAPFSGQLQETVRYQVGDKVSRGEKVALLVDDLKFRVPLYFSYAYDGQIQPGQQVALSVNASDLIGTVEEINMVRRVSAEGTLLFEVVAVVDNPGALTKGLSASASLTGADGSTLYPYEPGKLEYYRTMEIKTEPARSSSTKQTQVLTTALRDYADVEAGQVILTLSPEEFGNDLKAKNDQIIDARKAIDDQLTAIASSEKTVAEAQEKVKDAQKALDDFAAVSPLSGTVTSCALVEGQEVKSGDSVITISNNTTMVVTIQVDDRNIAYVKPGMGVDLQSNWGEGGTYFGTVTKIDMSLSGDAMGSGMTNYPVTLEVDNADGTLLEGMWLNYSFVTSQSDNCIVVPMQSVKYVSLEDGETASVVFIEADSPPENGVDIDIPEAVPGQSPTYPSQKEGFYPVVVETGLSDSYNVEITSGLQGGENVFVNYFVEQAWG